MEGQGVTQLPDFATNHLASEAAITVADRVNELFRLLRENKVQPPPIAIATAYINPAGFALLADELEIAPRVRPPAGSGQKPSRCAQSRRATPTRIYGETQLSVITRRGLRLSVTRWGFKRMPTVQAKRMVDWIPERGSGWQRQS